MLIPYNTDAPIYYWPWATIGLIVINTVVFVATAAAVADVDGGSAIEGFLLQFDQINPVQWLTTNFMHADLMHLIGNMFFLWGFGLVVEGKLGWYRFLPVYLGVGLVYGALIQIPMYLIGSEGAALGASAAIFGLMGMAVIWAPKNEMHCLLWLGIFSRTVDVSVLAFGVFYLALQILFLVLSAAGGHIGVSSEVLHLAGLLVGVPVGIVMLKRNWVDCEGWDLFSKGLSGDKSSSPGAPRSKPGTIESEREKRAIENREERKSEALMIRDAFRQSLAQGQARAAFALYNKVSDAARDRHWKLKPQDLVALVNCMHQAKMWSESVPVMVKLIQRCPDQANPIRIKLAQILLQVEQRPRQAIKVLSGMRDPVTEKAAQQRKAIVAKAKQAIDSGAIEVPMDLGL